MFFVTLTFGANRQTAAQHMDGHKAWLKRGFDDGVFLVAGSLAPGEGDDGGGGIVAHGLSRTDLERRVAEDPFVAEGVVRPRIVELAPARADDRLAFLLS
ncbi:YciI family protein [Marinibaculum pumilum]|uniref:YciI family protein n=1 Tax=Marinibaculum pumilum TaxID=1766165 RepID=A0ABV7L1I9_9PROT